MGHKGKRCSRLRSIPSMTDQSNLPAQSNNDGTDTEQDNDNVYKHKGQIVFRMDNFKAFSEGKEPKEVLSEPVVYVDGLAWRTLIKHNDDSFGFYLRCFGNETDFAWTCMVKKQLSVVPRAKDGTRPLVQGNFDEINTFDAMTLRWGWDKFAKFAEVMDTKNGFYDATEDAVTLKAEVITTKSPQGMPGVRTVDVVRVNGKKVYVNKSLLVAHSEPFSKLFSENADQPLHITIDQAVPTFERLLATMYPSNAELDDDCVEGVLRLASYFAIDDVVQRCANFLLTKSKKSAICKFRLADQSAITGMKKKVLQEMTTADFNVAGAAFMNIFLDYNKLEGRAVSELGERHAQLFGAQ